MTDNEKHGGLVKYVVGFLFDPLMDYVTMIRKRTPQWQRGFLNGVGGKIEPGEEPIQAMKREFEEEAGKSISTWRHFTTLYGKECEIYFFYDIDSTGFSGVETKTEEAVNQYLVEGIHRYKTLPNIPWLLHMAISFERNERCERFEVHEIY